MSSHIFTVTAITKDFKGPFATRCFGFYFTENAARNAALNNRGGMDECLYEYLVIEKQGEGIHAHAKDIQWYRWYHPEGQEGHWVESERPRIERFQRITNFNCIG